MDSKTRTIIIIVAIVALIIISVVIVMAATGKTKKVTQGSTTQNTPGITSILCQYFPKYCGGGTGSDTGPGIEPYVGQFKCNCGNPGYTTDGRYQESCLQGRVDYGIDCGG